MTDMETSVDDFRELVGQPRLKRLQANLAKKAVEELLEIAMEVLNKQMDKVMLHFSFPTLLSMKGIKRPGLLWINHSYFFVVFNNTLYLLERREFNSRFFCFYSGRKKSTWSLSSLPPLQFK